MSYSINLQYNNETIKITVFRSNRRSIGIKIDSTGFVSVRTPLFVTKRQVKQFITLKQKWIYSKLIQIKLKEDNNKLIFPLDPGEIRNVKILLKNKITILTKKYSKIIGVEYNRIFVKSQKTIWGSCSSKKNLNFNWKIYFTTSELIEYLVIHEVCHLKHMNHSNDYWKLVESLCPEYKRLRKELKEYILT